MRHRVAGLALAVLLFGACTMPRAPFVADTSPAPTRSPSAAATPRFSPYPPASSEGVPSPSAQPLDSRPGVRAGAALEYDPISHQLLLIGGMDDPLHPTQSKIVPGLDFWGWRPDTGWTLLTTRRLPAAGYGSAMAWDPGVGRTVLITASGSDIWTWDGVDWSGAGAGPSVESLSGLAYDAGSRRLVVLGQPAQQGLAASGTRVQSPGPGWEGYQGEAMWSWDGSGWALEPTPMSPRWEAAVAFDTERGQLVVYGGFGNGDNATWIWDGAAWTQHHTSGFPLASQTVAAYDAVRHEIVQYAPGGQTWTWDGSTWTMRSSTGPGIRRDESMAFDAAIGKVVLFGGKTPTASGETYLNDLWSWDGTSWSPIG